jgi:proteasome lid subunit RPN8/RPN11
LVHNHPSGNPKPSQADIRFTNRLKRLSNELDLPLLDHFVVSGSRMERVGIGICESLDDYKKRTEEGHG